MDVFESISNIEHQYISGRCDTILTNIQPVIVGKSGLVIEYCKTCNFGALKDSDIKHFSIA